MKRLCKIIVFIQVILIIFALMSATEVNTFASSSINANNTKIANVAVLLRSFEDVFSLQIKQSLEDIEKENEDNVRFTFYDGKNNVAVQDATIDSILKSNVDLFIMDLVDIKEENVRNVISTISPKGVPIIFMGVQQEVVTKVSSDYSKAVFVYSTSSGEGTLQGKIIVDEWNANKELIDRNKDNILQYVLLRGERNNPYTIERSKDAISAINKAGIKTEELASANANWVKDLAIDIMNNFFIGYDGRIEAVIANNDAMAIGAIKAIQKYGYNKGDKNKSMVVVGIDGLKEAIDLIDKGEMTGTLIHGPQMAAEVLYKIGMNLINNKNPIENTNYKLSNGLIKIPESYQPYKGKASTK